MIIARPILPNTTVSDNGVYTINISDKQKLHGLVLEVTATNGSTAGLNVLDMITNIKLIKDGTEEIIYGSGNALHSIAHDVGVNSLNDTYSLAASAAQAFNIPLLLGNDIIDPNHWLDLANVDLLQLVITYAFTIAVTGFVTGSIQFGLTGYYEYDQPIDVYKGYLRTRQADSYTALASGAHSTLFPTAAQMSSVHLVSNTYAGNIVTPIGNIQYRSNQGDRIFWNDTAAKLQRQGAAMRNRVSWVQAAALATLLPRIASFFHSIDNREELDPAKNQFSQLELIQTNQSATGTVIVAYREVVS